MLTAKRAETWVGFPVIFFPGSDDRLSLNFHRFLILYIISCDTRSVGLGQYCLRKVSNGFKDLRKALITHRLSLLSFYFALLLFELKQLYEIGYSLKIGCL